MKVTHKSTGRRIYSIVRLSDNPLVTPPKVKKPSKRYTLQYKERLTRTQFSIRKAEPRSHWGPGSDWSNVRIWGSVLAARPWIDIPLGQKTSKRLVQFSMTHDIQCIQGIQGIQGTQGRWRSCFYITRSCSSFRCFRLFKLVWTIQILEVKRVNFQKPTSWVKGGKKWSAPWVLRTAYKMHPQHRHALWTPLVHIPKSKLMLW